MHARLQVHVVQRGGFGLFWASPPHGGAGKVPGGGGAAAPPAPLGSLPTVETYTADAVEIWSGMDLYRKFWGIRRWKGLFF